MRLGSMQGIFLGLGSNKGNRELFLHQAIAKLKAIPELEIRRYSSIYESEPVGLKEQAWFLNAVVEISTKLDPFLLLAATQNIERQLGRKRTRRWGARIIDIDILSFNDLIIQSYNLIIPHPEMTVRKFVLMPLSEISPTYFHPITKISITHLLAHCPPDQVRPFSRFNFDNFIM
jgi:2-amino-4-hydroxy-6-hydroxymethyldihydropteridine diphosphokinase